MTFEKFEREVLPERIAESILNLIRERRLSPGDRLPPERELAEAMGVSRHSLRGALRALAMMNIVEIRQGSGTYVSSLETEELVEPLSVILSLNDSTFLNLVEVRKGLEPEGAAIAAERITDSEIEELETCLAKSAETVQDAEAFLQADIELHRIITQSTRNPILIRIMDSVTYLGLASRKRTASLPGIRQEVLQSHQHIVDALKARDSDAARQAMRNHLTSIERRLQHELSLDESINQDDR